MSLVAVVSDNSCLFMLSDILRVRVSYLHYYIIDFPNIQP